MNIRIGITSLAALALLVLAMPGFTQTKSVAKAEKCGNCVGIGAKKVAGKRDACAVPVTLALSGLHCDGCAQTVTQALMQVKGVEEANVNATKQQAIVWVCPHKGVKNESLTAAVKKAGYKVVKVTKGQPKAGKI